MEVFKQFKVKCVDNVGAEHELVRGEIYTAIGQSSFTGALNLAGVQSAWSSHRFSIVEDEPFTLSAKECIPDPEEEQRVIDAHYSFNYTLTEADLEKGVIKVDPYFVAKQWRLGSKDDTGVLFHCLKNISRYSDKNTKEREIMALHLQVKRLAELEGVDLNK